MKKRFIIITLILISIFIKNVNAATVDNNPPTLNSFSIEEDEVKPGEYIHLVIDAEDDISGLKDGSIGLYSELKGYAVYQLDIEDLNNPIITIPENAIGGEYLISHLMLEDKSGNMITYYNEELEKGKATDDMHLHNFNDIRINIISDTNFTDDKEAPVAKEVTVDKKTITLGEEIRMCAKVEDKSEIKFIDITMSIKNNYMERVSGEMKKDSETGLYCATLKPDRTGIYVVQYINLTDMYDNQTNFFPSNTSTKTTNVLDMPEIEVLGPENDIESPVLKGITINKLNLIAPGNVKVFIEADDNSGENLKEVNLRFISEDYYNKNEKNGTYSDGELYTVLYYDKVINKYVGTLEIDQYAVSGNYYLQKIILTDNKGNSSQYVTSHYPKGMSGGYSGTLRKREVIDDVVFEIKEEFAYDVVTSTINNNLIDTIKSQKDDAVIMIDATNDFIVSEEVFEAIQGTNKTIYIEANGYQWVFNGKDITDIKRINAKVNCDLLVDVNIDNTFQEYIAIVFANNGYLPGKAKIRVKTDYTFRYMEWYKDLRLFYYNSDEEKYKELDNEILLTEDGFYEFEITHNSKYVLSNKKIDKKFLTNNEDDTEEDDEGNFFKDNYLYILIGVIVLIIVIIIFVVKKHKTDNSIKETINQNNEGTM